MIWSRDLSMLTACLLVTVTAAGYCPFSWTDKIHREESVLYCHIPPSVSADNNNSDYCLSIGAIYQADDGEQLCLKQEGNPEKRQWGFLGGGVPPPGGGQKKRDGFLTGGVPPP